MLRWFGEAFEPVDGARDKWSLVTPWEKEKQIITSLDYAKRLGRIHRIGQERDAYAFNFVATDSEDGQPVIEGRILHRLLEKLDQMRQTLVGRVFVVVGEVLSLSAVNLAEMLREAAYDPRRLDEYIDQIDRIDPARLRQYEEATGIALARGHVDFSAFQARNLEIEERRLMPRYVEAHFLAAAAEVGLRVDPRVDGLWRIEHVPADLRSDRLEAVRRLGTVGTVYRKITFHKHHLQQDAHLDAVLLGPGHSLHAAVDERLNTRLAACLGGTAVRGKDTWGSDVNLYGELVAVREESGRYEVVPADMLLNLTSHLGPPAALPAASPKAAEDFLRSTYQLQCRDRCRQEREHFASVCRDYLLRSLDARKRKAQERVIALMARERTSLEVAVARQQAEKDLADLERTQAERLAGLDRLGTTRTGPVRHLASALVLSPREAAEAQLADLADEADPEVRTRSELAAEEVAIAALVSEGFPRENIERVGAQKIGFDLHAHRLRDPVTGEIEVKRVEVKGRVRGQPVRLTTNEWYKAQQLAETYWLNVVWDPLSESSESMTVHNPAARLDHAKREIVAARFFKIPADTIGMWGERR